MLQRAYKFAGVAIVVALAIMAPVRFSNASAGESGILTANAACADQCICGCIYTGGLIDLCSCEPTLLYHICNINCDDPCHE